MQRNRKRLVILALAAVLIGCGVLCYFLFVERATEYSRAAFYPDTGITRMPDERDMWRYGEKQGRVTLVLSRGKPHSTVTTAHGWWEVLSIEWPSTPTVGKVDMRAGKVIVGFWCYYTNTFWVIGDKGVSGWLDIEAVDEDQITATHDITLDAFSPVFLPEYQHRRVYFEGKSVFQRRQRPVEPECAGNGKLFP